MASIEMTEVSHNSELHCDMLVLDGAFPERNIYWTSLVPYGSKLWQAGCGCGTHHVQNWPGFRDQSPTGYALAQVYCKLPHWPLSNTLTLPSPPTKYNSSFDSICMSHLAASAAPTPILITPLTSLAVPVSSNLKLIVRCAWCAKLSRNAA